MLIFEHRGLHFFNPDFRHLKPDPALGNFVGLWIPEQLHPDQIPVGQLAHQRAYCLSGNAKALCQFLICCPAVAL